MDDGGSPHIGLIVLLLFLILHIVLYGCLSAMSNMNEGLSILNDNQLIGKEILQHL